MIQMTISEDKGQLKDYIPTMLVVFFIFVIIPTIFFFRPPDEGPVAIIFPFSFSQSESFSALLQTDARLIRYGATSNIMIVESQTQTFSDDIKKLGAWAVVNPLGLGGCSSDLPFATTAKKN